MNAAPPPNSVVGDPIEDGEDGVDAIEFGVVTTVVRVDSMLRVEAGML